MNYCCGWRYERIRMNDRTDKITHWTHSSRNEFYDDYAKKSESPEAYQRFMRLYDIVTTLMTDDSSLESFDVADIGCGAGTQCRIWADKGHNVTGLDVNEPLLDLAKKRAQNANLAIKFTLGSATRLPWGNASKDVCLVPELLEHVADWRSCVFEIIRVLRPGGVVILTTTNKLCPKQQEFNLPLYSWFPKFIKKYFEHLAVTTHPSLANYATYPAVNWFTYFQLEKIFNGQGFRCFDRFDVMDLDGKSQLTKKMVHLIRKVFVLRWLAHVLTPYTLIAARKNNLP